MSEDRESFVFHKDWYYAIKKRSPQLRVEIYDAIMQKVFEGTQKELSEVASVVMDLISPQIDRDTAKWLDIKAKRRESGKQGGLAKQANATKCYQMLPNDSKSKQNVANLPVSVCVSDSVSVDNNSVIIKEKENTIISSKKKAPKSDEQIAIAPEMQEVVDTWLQYKKEKGQSYKPTGFKTFYKKLCELSGNNPQVAMAIIEQSMQNNYAGIFPLKNNNNNNYARTTTNSDRFIDSVREANDFAAQLRANIDKQTDMGYGNSEEVW